MANLSDEIWNQDFGIEANLCYPNCKNTNLALAICFEFRLNDIFLEQVLIKM